MMTKMMILMIMLVTRTTLSSIGVDDQIFILLKFILNNFFCSTGVWRQRKDKM